jgi:hypothetical protein
VSREVEEEVVVVLVMVKQDRETEEARWQALVGLVLVAADEHIPARVAQEQEEHL